MKTRTLRSPARGEPSAIRARGPRARKAFAQLLRSASKRRSREREPDAVDPTAREGRARPGHTPKVAEKRREADDRAEPRELEPRQPEPEPLEPFSPLPSVVASTLPGTTEVAAVGTSWDRAQVAAMAERMLTSFRRGEVDGQDEVRMQLRMLDAEVHVRVEEGRVVATLVGDGLEGLARTLERELQTRGLDSEITLAPD